MSRSAEDAAAPAVTLAVMRLVTMFDGASPPKVSCVILPIAPMGVMSDSPVARQATMARKNVISTATIPIQSEVPKAK